MGRIGDMLRRWLRRSRNDSTRCPACETTIPPRSAFCSHCYMVFRPEGMAELHRALQGAKVSDEIYLLRKLHDTTPEDVIPLGHEATGPLESPPPPSSTRTSASTPGEAPGPSSPAPASRRPGDGTPGLMTYAFPVPPPAVAVPEDLPALVRWFLNHDPLVPNNVEILEEAQRTLYGTAEGWTYERHLTWAIADDLHTYDAPDLLQEHLTRLTTVYARTLQALRNVGSSRPAFQSPADLPEPERRRMWELCLRLGLTATRVRVEGWIHQQGGGDVPRPRTMTSDRPVGTRPGRA